MSNVQRTHGRHSKHGHDIAFNIAADYHILHDLMPHEGKYYDRTNKKYENKKEG